MPSYLARTGLAIFAMVFAIVLLSERPAEGRALVAGSSAIDLPALREVAVAPLALASVNVAIPAVEESPLAPVVRAPKLAAATVVGMPASQTDPLILASWYGPGFYGNRTACGQLYTPEILGVAHLTLPCGTPLTLTYGSSSIVVTVIDRGPYVAGRTVDLSNATRLALGCTDLCTLRMHIGQ